MKDTTYVLGFLNDPNEVLVAFRTYYQTAELEDVTDPNLVFNLQAKHRSGTSCFSAPMR